jgi:hypothetical protein
MSQIIKNLAAGPVPPSVATQYDGNTGIAIPALNILNVLGSGAVNVVGSGNTLTISVSGGGLTWTDQATSFNTSSNNGYFTTGTLTATLPASPAQGDTINFIVDTTNILTIQANTGQKIRVGTNISASAGTCVNEHQGDGIELVYRASDATWISFASPQGTWTVT